MTYCAIPESTARNQFDNQLGIYVAQTVIILWHGLQHSWRILEFGRWIKVVQRMLLRTRSSTSSSGGGMGLLDGLATLQGAPPPLPVPSTTTTRGSDPLSAFSDSAKNMLGDLGTSLSGGVDQLGEAANKSVSSLRRLMGDESVDAEAPAPAPVQQTLREEVGQFFQLSLLQRVALFAMCFGAGVLMIFISFSFLPLIVLSPHKFASAFTMGNVLAIMSTWILVGPRAQLQNMFHPGRAVAACMYVGSLLFALFAAFFGGRLRYILVLIALVIEIISLVWYALSYIPYGRTILSRAFGVTSWA